MPFRTGEKPRESTPSSDPAAYTPRQRETADYVCAMVLELRNAVVACHLVELAEVLKQAYYKSYAITHRVEVPPAEVKHIRLLEKASQESEESIIHAFQTDPQKR